MHYHRALDPRLMDIKDTMGPLNPVSVKAVFDLPEQDNIIETYTSENCETARIGLPENTVPSKV